MARRWKTAAHSHGKQNECGHCSCLLVLLPPVPFPVTVMLRLTCIAVMPTDQQSSQTDTTQKDNEETLLWLQTNSLVLSNPLLHPSIILFQLSRKHELNF